jgi:hypothetical protein
MAFARFGSAPTAAADARRRRLQLARRLETGLADGLEPLGTMRFRLVRPDVARAAAPVLRDAVDVLRSERVLPTAELDRVLRAGHEAGDALAGRSPEAAAAAAAALWHLLDTQVVGTAPRVSV